MGTKEEKIESRLEQKEPHTPKHGPGYKRSQVRAYRYSGAVTQNRHHHDCSLQVLEQAMAVKDTVEASVPVCKQSMR